MEWTDPWFIAYIHDDARDKHYMTTWKHPMLMLRDLVADNLLCYPTTLCLSLDFYGGFAWNGGNRVVHDENNDDDAYADVTRTIVLPVESCPYLDSEGRIPS